MSNTEYVKSLKPGDTVWYVFYGLEKSGIVARIGPAGYVWLTNGRFLFPESLILPR